MPVAEPPLLFQQLLLTSPTVTSYFPLLQHQVTCLMSQIIWSEFSHGCLCSGNSFCNSNIWMQLIKVLVFDPLNVFRGWRRWQCLKTIIFFRNVTLSLSLVACFDEVPLRSVGGCSRHFNKYTKENKQRAKTGGCSIIKGAWLPEGISCSYLPLCVSLWMNWDHQRGDSSSPGCSSVSQDHLSLPGRSRSITHENRHAGSF